MHAQSCHKHGISQGGAKILPEPVTDVIVRKPQKRQLCEKGGLKSTVYEARVTKNSRTDPTKLAAFVDTLKSENRKFGFSYIVNPENENTEKMRTMLGTDTPKGSILSYQLSITEGNFTVSSDISSVPINAAPEILPANYSYPLFPLKKDLSYALSQSIVQNFQPFYKSIQVDDAASIKIEQSTLRQRDDDTWYKERRFRIIASTFGDIIIKMTNGRSNLKKLAEKLVAPPKDLTRVAAINWSIKNEICASEQYTKYMKKIGRPVIVAPSGLVVNPAYPWIGASPDGKITDVHADPVHGLLEINAHTHFEVLPQRMLVGRLDFFASWLIKSGFEERPSEEEEEEEALLNLLVITGVLYSVM